MFYVYHDSTLILLSLEPHLHIKLHLKRGFYSLQVFLLWKLNMMIWSNAVILKHTLNETPRSKNV